MHAPAPAPKSAPAPAADSSEWTIPAAAPTAADAARLLSFFSSGRRSTVGEVQPPQVPYGVRPATSTAFWATDAYSLDLEVSAAEVRQEAGGTKACWRRRIQPKPWMARAAVSTQPQQLRALQHAPMCGRPCS